MGRIPFGTDKLIVILWSKKTRTIQTIVSLFHRQEWYWTQKSHEPYTQAETGAQKHLHERPFHPFEIFIGMILATSFPSLILE